LAINPPSDIVLGVANAADPQKLRAAAAQLARAGGNSVADAATLTGADAGALRLASRASRAKAPPVFDPQALASTAQAAKLPQGAAAKRTPDAYTKFEAFLIQTFVESMLPADAPNVYGTGVAGKIWKSMLAEHLANAIAKGTAFGIADQIAKHREKRGKGDAPGVTASSGQDIPANHSNAGAVADLHSLISAPAQPQAALPARPDFG
jgi:Rod binding domain-containing protein